MVGIFLFLWVFVCLFVVPASQHRKQLFGQSRVLWESLKVGATPVFPRLSSPTQSACAAFHHRLGIWVDHCGLNSQGETERDSDGTEIDR